MVDHVSIDSPYCFAFIYGQLIPALILKVYCTYIPETHISISLISYSAFCYFPLRSSVLWTLINLMKMELYSNESAAHYGPGF